MDAKLARGVLMYSWYASLPSTMHLNGIKAGTPAAAAEDVAPIRKLWAGICRLIFVGQMESFTI